MPSAFESYAANSAIMEGLRRGHQNFREAMQVLVKIQTEKAINVVKSLTAMGHRANRNIGGLRQVAEIPLAIKAAWAAKFKAQDEEAGIYNTTGWERWHPSHEFYQWFKKNNPEFFVEEQKSGNSIIVPAAKYERVSIRARDDANKRTGVSALPSGAVTIKAKSQGAPVIKAREVTA